MNNQLKLSLIIILSFLAPLFCYSQQARSTSEILKEVGNNWKTDSLSCKGYRLKLTDRVVKSKIDTITKDLLFSNLGKPNRIQKFYSGNTNKNYVGYIYYIYLDECPKMQVAGAAIQFVFEETGVYLVEITEIDYCG
jgi:hypothetical protein